MLPLHYAARWRLASWLLIATILAAALVPAAWFWGAEKISVSWFEHSDKLLHAATFLILSTWYTGQYQRNSYWQIAMSLLVFGVFIEACQALVTYRTADWNDVAADAAGIIIGLAIGTAGIGGWCLRVEERLAQRRQ